MTTVQDAPAPPSGPGPGRPRGYGHDATGAPVPDEADLLREVARRVLAGSSFSAEAHNLNAHDIRGPGGGIWHAATLSRLLVAPRLAGLRPATRSGPNAAPILDEATHKALVALSRQRRESGRGRPSGSDTALLTAPRPGGGCGLCGQPLTLSAGSTYRCPHGRVSPTGQVSCGRIAVNAAALDAYVADRARAAWTALGADARTRLAARENPLVTRLRAELAELDTAAGGLRASRDAGILTAGEYDAARRRIAERRTRRNRRLAAVDERARALPVTDDTTGPETLAAWWEAADMGARQALVAAVFERVDVLPARRPGPGKRRRRTPSADRVGGLDPARVRLIAATPPASAAA